ncbi:cupin domain-containing protein [Mesobacillus maritimus]|uniref:cupin domain-containing protein n=1 Tax=Mesobacillus maritimus TaxID=1643336 RepID=UPI00203E4B48|nr:cupin domain-containing protein [Mesobacillus maritimus]MCM3584843.1 cupin domain-containing protein [Mesobacillus maritimus]MCM3671256.1 cupin domain-containing protein [Mesobacillus maritimus]
MYNGPYYYSNPYPYQNLYYGHTPMRWHNEYITHDTANTLGYNQSPNGSRMERKDYGMTPFVLNINEAAKRNKNYRTTIWTGNHLQVTLMSIKVGESIGLEMHPHLDQFLRIEQGQGIVQMGKHKNQLNFVRKVGDDSAIMVPAGTWHNVTNTGNVPLKLYSIYAPPQHPFGTVHVTKADALAAERIAY